MEPQVYRQFYEVQQRHWWFRGRRELVKSLLTGRIHSRGRALDVGCGAGSNLGVLQEFSEHVTALDASPLAIELARRENGGVTFVQGDANHLETTFAPESFDLISIQHVLYHQWVRSVPDVIRQVASLLRPGGVLVVTDPSLKWAVRDHDRQVMTRERFSTREYARWIEAAGLKTTYVGYFNAWSVFPVFILTFIDRITSWMRSKAGRQVDEVRLPPAPLNRLFEKFLSFENAWITHGHRLPFGLSLIAIAEKRAR